MEKEKQPTPRNHASKIKQASHRPNDQPANQHHTPSTAVSEAAKHRVNSESL